jgi:hypothetical protein
MQKNIRDAMAPIARMMPMAIPAFAPAVMSPESAVAEGWEILLEVAADNAAADEDEEDWTVAVAESNGRVLATDFEGERIEAGKLSDLPAEAAVVCAAVLIPRFVVTVVSWTSGDAVAAAGWPVGRPGVVYPATEPSNVGLKVL